VHLVDFIIRTCSIDYLGLCGNRVSVELNVNRAAKRHTMVTWLLRKVNFVFLPHEIIWRCGGVASLIINLNTEGGEWSAAIPRAL
jgi:hypothetical protein